jgi:hypothetical protein
MLDAHTGEVGTREEAAVGSEQRRWHIGEKNAAALSRCGNVTFGACRAPPPAPAQRISSAAGFRTLLLASNGPWARGMLLASVGRFVPSTARSE